MEKVEIIQKRLWILVLVLGLGFSSIWLLPKHDQMVPSLLVKDLPESLGSWVSKRQSVSDAERKILAADTEFARRYYQNREDPHFTGVEASVVFSGKDINNSIHRPEICLRAQGWNFKSERSLKIPGVLPDGEGLPVREIVCVRPRIAADGGEVPQNKDGEPVYDKRIQYYTFFGADEIVSGHYERTFADIRGRLFGGYDQQWAYATFSVGVTSVYQDQGFEIPEEANFDAAQSREKLEEFLKLLLPKIVPHNKQK